MCQTLYVHEITYCTTSLQESLHIALFYIDFQCVKSKSVTNLAEATADPVVDSSGNPINAIALLQASEAIPPEVAIPLGPDAEVEAAAVLGLPPDPEQGTSDEPQQP